jgi:hypothetical protein
MIGLFNALIVVMIRQGKYKDVVDVVHEFCTLVEYADFSELLNWPYNKAETVHCYEEMLNKHIRSLNEEQDMTDY